MGEQDPQDSSRELRRQDQEEITRGAIGTRGGATTRSRTSTQSRELRGDITTRGPSNQTPP